jgi:hypothetical protein
VKARDFKSRVSTDFTIGACCDFSPPGPVRDARLGLCDDTSNEGNLQQLAFGGKYVVYFSSSLIATNKQQQTAGVKLKR